MSPTALALAGLVALALGSLGSAQIQKLSPPLGQNEDVDGFEVSPDGLHAVYLVRRSSGRELYSAGLPLGGIKRLEALPCSSNFEIGGDSRRVVYARFRGAFETCSVPLDGSEDPVVLGSSTSFHVTADGQTVVFLDPEGLKRVPVDGSAPAVLIHSSEPWNVHFLFDLTPDGTRVVYVTEGSIRGEGGAGHIWSAVLDGSAVPVRLNVAESQATAGSFLCSPDSKWVVFRHGRIKGFSRWIYSVPLDGGVLPVRLNPTPSVGSVSIFTILARPCFSPDGKRVVYPLEQEVDGRQELYSAPIHGGDMPVKLNPPLQEGGWVSYHRLTPDGAQVLFLVSESASAPFELFSVPILGGTPLRLSPAGEPVELFEPSPDGRHVAYVSDPDGGEARQLFLAALVPGPGVRRLSDPAATPYVAAGLPGELAFDAEGRRIAYTAFVRVDSGPRLRELHAARTDGSAPPVRLDGPSVPGSSVLVLRPFQEDAYTMRFAAGANLAVFVADRETNNAFELWASPLEKPSSRRRR